MLSLIHTPIEDREAALALKLTHQWYRLAQRRGVLRKTYFDNNDELSRIQAHNTADLLHYSVIAALGWPTNSLNDDSDNVDFVFDVIADFWEQANVSNHRDQNTSAAAFIDQMARRISASNELDFLLDQNQKASLTESVRSICLVLELIILRSLNSPRFAGG